MTSHTKIKRKIKKYNDVVKLRTIKWSPFVYAHNVRHVVLCGPFLCPASRNENTCS